jgi:hypothetical protein
MEKTIKITGDNIQISDCYHTFDELYEHRISLFIALARILRRQENQLPKVEGIAYVWRSKLHSDGSSFDGWFVLGLGFHEGEQMTYHLPDSRWEETAFAETLEKAPEFDDHTSDDVLQRLKNI